MLRELRENAFAQHLALGIPTTKDEEFKYTSLRGLTESAYYIQAGPAQISGEDLAQFSYGDLDQIRIVFVNGFFSEELTTSLQGFEGVEIRTLDCALDNRQEVVETYLGKLAKTDESTFAALNTATFTGGVYVHLARNARVDKPIHFLNITAADPNGAVSYTAPRTLIIAEEGAEASFIETYATVGKGKTFSNAVTEVYVAPNANIEHVKVQQESLDAYHIATCEVKQERDSTYRHYNVTYGGRLTRNDINVFLNGSNLHTRMDGIVVIDGEQLADNHTRLDHAFPHCDSFEVYKHVLGGHSTGVFNGKIFVHQDAQKTDAKQTNNTILLSERATINSKPQLEIFADDVKCTHGATVGQLDKDPMFYLQSRGIPRDKAEAMLVYAFAADILERIENRQLVDRLEAMLYEKLGS
jgi:Fe-S cluster assembly protein SufD